MKKKFIFPALALLTGAFILAVTGCATENPYQVATRESSGITSLAQNETKSQARVMYEEARADGYTGGFVDFLKEIGISADDSFSVGSALLSAVEVYAGFERQSATSGLEAYRIVGSGVIYEKNGGDAYVLTNYHIVYNASSSGRETIPHISDNISLCLYGGQREAQGIAAEYVGGAMNYDIAVLRVENSKELLGSDARAVAVADSDGAAVGERVYAVGNPDGKGLSAVGGILSVEAEYITLTAADEQTRLSMLEMRTDAPVNHGNSGGGLFDAEGRLLGIVNARSEKEGVEHLGYAIPSNLACAVAQNIIDNSKADNSRGAMRATLGVTFEIADSHSEYDEASGRTLVKETVAVQSVDRGPAYEKFKTGDVIRAIKIGGGAEKQITRFHMVTETMFRVRRGDEVTFTLERGGKTVEIVLSFENNDDFKLFK